MIRYRRIPIGSADYQCVLALRDAVLRRPLGLSVHDEDLEQEKTHQAHGLFDGSGKLLACLMIVPQQGGAAKLRQMAVDPSWQGKGLGRQLISAVEQDLCEQGVCRVDLHARVTAVPFYDSLAYQAVGKPFTEVGIAHQKMFKLLSRDS